MNLVIFNQILLSLFYVLYIFHDNI